MMAEYIQCFDKEKKKGSGVKNRWISDGNTIKFNTDGAFVPSQSVGAWGIVARKKAEKLLRLKQAGCGTAHDAFSAELRAMEEANLRLEHVAGRLTM
jgi:hypothetical protein